MTRRGFLAASSATLMMPMGMAAPIPDILFPASNQPYAGKPLIDWSYGMRPLFCIAYIDPGIKSQQGQEEQVAKYPIALVPQDDRAHFRWWRERVRRLNPNIKMLAYQMVIEETTVPGPGHDVMRSAEKSWFHRGEISPTVTYRTSTSAKRKRIFDPRLDEWQEKFLSACDQTLRSDDYAGIFLDQCTIYRSIIRNPIVYREMTDALQQTLLALRERHPSKIIIGNSRDSWLGLNGEMNESRPKDLKKETRILPDRGSSRLELFHYYMQNHHDTEAARKLFLLALENKAFFGVNVNAQTVREYKFIDEVLDDYIIKAS